MKKINFLFIILIILKVIDVMITFYGLSLGFVELSPLGFNAYSIAFNGILIFAFGCFVYLNKDKVIEKFAFVGLILFNGILLYAFIHNSIEVFKYFTTV